MESTKKIYIGGGEDGVKRLANIQKLADKHFEGNVSALFNDAIDRLYHLDRYTGEPMEGKPPKDQPRMKRGRRQTMRPKT